MSGTTSVEPEDRELDSLLQDYGLRWRTAATDDGAVASVLVPYGRSDLPDPRTKRALPDLVLAGLAALAAAAVLVVAVLGLGGLRGGGREPDPVSSTGTTPVVKDPVEGMVSEPTVYRMYTDVGRINVLDVAWSRWDGDAAVGSAYVYGGDCPEPCGPQLRLDGQVVARNTTITFDEVKEGRYTRITLNGGRDSVNGATGTRMRIFHWQDWHWVPADPAIGGDALAVSADGDDGALTRPGAIQFGTPPWRAVTAATWSRWGGDGATGAADYDQCDTSCGHDPSHHATVRIALDAVRDGRYTRATITDTGSGGLPGGTVTLFWTPAAGGGGAWSTSTAPMTTVNAGTAADALRPTSMSFGGTGRPQLENVAWDAWGHELAIGSGDYRQSGGGAEVRATFRIRLSEPVDGRFTRANFAVVDHKRQLPNDFFTLRWSATAGGWTGDQSIPDEDKP